MMPRKQRIAGLLLAAGASTRMGKAKQLLPIGEKSMLGRILDESLRSELDEIVLVLGCGAQEIRRHLGSVLLDPKLRLVENREYKRGISSSLICGLSAVEDTCDHVMVLLADMPHIDAELINFLLNRYLASGSALGALKVGQRRSHPVIFSRKIYPDLRKLRGDTGGRDLFLKYHTQVCLVEPGRPYDDKDIDTLQDYQRFLDSVDRS
jgi:molybdenum cofactor cytidylyltransferase